MDLKRIQTQDPADLLIWILTGEVDNENLLWFHQNYYRTPYSLDCRLKGDPFLQVLEEAMAREEQIKEILASALSDIQQAASPRLYHALALHPLFDPVAMQVTVESAPYSPAWIYAHHNPSFVFHAAIDQNLVEWCRAHRNALSVLIEPMLHEKPGLVMAIFRSYLEVEEVAGITGAEHVIFQLVSQRSRTKIEEVLQIVYTVLVERDKNPLATTLRQGRWFRERLGGSHLPMLLDKLDGDWNPS